MNTWFKENVMSSSMCKLVISVLLGALLVTISMVFLANEFLCGPSNDSGSRPIRGTE